MAIKATELGKTIILATGFDLSGKDTVTVTITDTDGTEVTVTDDRITIPGVTYASSELGTLSANEYAQFTTLATDFPSADTYSLYVTYNDATSTFYSDAASVTVEAKGT